MDPLCEALLARCARMARMARVAPAARDVAEVKPNPVEFEAAAARHGLTRGPEDQGPDRRTRQAGKNLLAIYQLQEIAAAFARKEIPVIALKGAAALLTLYDEGAVRVMVDLGGERCGDALRLLGRADPGAPPERGAAVARCSGPRAPGSSRAARALGER